MSWNSTQSSLQNQLPHNMMSSADPNISYMYHARHEEQNSECCVGQASSGSVPNENDLNEGQTGNIFCSLATVTLGEHQCGPSNIFSSDLADVNSNGNPITNGRFLVRNSGHDVLPRDFNACSGYRNSEHDDSQLLERPNTLLTIGSSNEHITSAGGSSAPFGLHSEFSGYVIEDTENSTGSLGGGRASCKRKALEVVGESSGAGSSNCHKNAERSQWDAVSAAQTAVSNNRMPVQIDSNIGIHNRSQVSSSRLRIGVGEIISATPLPAETAETSLSNFFVQINGSQQQNHMPVNPISTAANFGNLDVSSSSRLDLYNRQLGLSAAPATETGSVHGQSALLQAPFARRNLQSRWNGSSSSRISRSSTSTVPLERDTALYEDTTQRNIPRRASDHPIFVPASQRISSRNPINWNFARGNNNVTGNIVSNSLVGSSLGVNSPAPNWYRQSCPQYPHRMSEIVRRSLLSLAGTDSGVQSSDPTGQSNSSIASQEMTFTFGSGMHSNHQSNSRPALLERRSDGAFGIPYPLRALASASEGRNTIVSEIRRVLDLMRRGEGLRLEDVMILENSVFFGMTDVHDRHRDMRLDVDNMSYEELLALEERIGNVCTGLSEETITNGLKKKKYIASIFKNPSETPEPCSICREEYVEGDDLGTLECGHDFHKDCIKQWLVQKNLCPICKTTGLTTRQGDCRTF